MLEAEGCDFLPLWGLSPLAPGGRVWKVKSAPQRPRSPGDPVSPAAAGEGGEAADRTVDTGVIPGEYRRLVREYFDAPGAAPAP